MTIREEILEVDTRIFKHFGRHSDLVLVGRQMEMALAEEARPSFDYAKANMCSDPVTILQDLLSQYVGIRVRSAAWMIGFMVLPPKRSRRAW